VHNKSKSKSKSKDFKDQALDLVRQRYIKGLRITHPVLPYRVRLTRQALRSPPPLRRDRPRKDRMLRKGQQSCQRRRYPGPRRATAARGRMRP